jgi:hypothetical protein
LTAHYCGTPQGRRPAENGPRGCTLVQVDEAMHCRTTMVATDAVRFHDERVVVGETTTAEQLQEVIDERTRELLADPFGPDWLCQWTVAGSRQLCAELDRGKLTGELTTRLRADHGGKRPAAWTVSISSDDRPAIEAGAYEEDSLVGEFLRTVEHFVEHAEEPLDLQNELSPRHAAGHVGAAVAIDNAAQRQRVLAEVARLGVELLSAPGGDR